MATQNVNSKSMKYIIKESQINNVMFWYLDNQDFIQIEKNNKIYFVNSEGDEFAQIRYDKEKGYCMLKQELVKEISSFFSLQTSDSEEIIVKWVENTIQMKVKYTSRLGPNTSSKLKIPN